eukprot:m.74586 g.74586  ORF g.74586 m.74586 type:complete len:92 (+) comp10312_c0_seq1:1109-1384(+)
MARPERPSGTPFRGMAGGTPPWASGISISANSSPASSDWRRMTSFLTGIAGGVLEDVLEVLIVRLGVARKVSVSAREEHVSPYARDAARPP